MSNSGFNPNARWDRHIPETEYGPDTENLDEKIQVLAYFNNAKVYPRIFIWNSRKYKIKNINYNWQERRGRELISYFSVSTISNLYKISFNNTTFGWKIDKIIE